MKSYHPLVPAFCLVIASAALISCHNPAANSPPVVNTPPAINSRPTANSPPTTDTPPTGKIAARPVEQPFDQNANISQGYRDRGMG